MFYERNNAMIEEKLCSIDEWADLAENERCELIAGKVIYKDIEGYTAEHGEFQSNLCAVLGEYNKNNIPVRWWIVLPVSVAYGNRHGFIHDLCGWRRDRHASKPSGKYVMQSPDWVCEILSSNKSIDIVDKKWIMHKHRVEYYWMVHLEEKIIQVFKWSESGYTNISDAKKGDKKRLEPFDNIEIDSTFLFGDDE